MLYTRKDIEGFYKEDNEEKIEGITGLYGKFRYQVAPEVQEYIDLLAEDATYVKDKGPCETIEDEKKRYVWHAEFQHIAQMTDEELKSEVERLRRKEHTGRK